ncbi:ABC transporter substrate-binding protein [Neptuniibacter sp. 1_MG-2023]|uniref:ABC transporter substrate-binding protein n=1 Tax=Neptuniibacter sp. 1_MG-2023 TaxID=3062662 RepID=UPI0026E2A00A|nr:ABC transporter substrate-binding protein [Neptuniibacter sp. 1_MG-2023]MDO6593238.1 ABC transporter substrate-binding protein [Neptuniibacter sp. 1_MG-2023]
MLINQSAASSLRGEKVRELGELKVCYWPDYFAISYKNPRTGRLEGIDIDMAKALATSMGVSLKLVESSFSSLIENLSNNACDIAMHAVGIRDDRKPYMEFSSPYLKSDIYAVGTKDSQYIASWEDIDEHGNVVVVQRGTFMEPVIKGYIKNAKVTIVDSFKAREQEVLSGRADVFMADYPYGKRMTQLTSWAVLFKPKESLAPTEYAYAVPKGELDWLQEINDFLLIMKKTGKLAQFAEKNGLSEIVVND